MIRLDYREAALVNRLVAQRDLANALEAIGTATGDVVVDIGSNVATTSWVDGFLAPLVASTGRRVTVIADSNVTLSHIERVFQARGRRIEVARNEEDAAHGAVYVIPAA
jgi:predicted site-specific integrase-resolvase